jgi:hypothetical protein
MKRERLNQNRLKKIFYEILYGRGKNCENVT